MEEYKNEIIRISSQYAFIHERLSNLQSTITFLIEQRDQIQSELIKNKEDEALVINKIEESIGRPLTQEDLIDLVKKPKNENE